MRHALNRDIFLNAPGKLSLIFRAIKFQCSTQIGSMFEKLFIDLFHLYLLNCYSSSFFSSFSSFSSSTFPSPSPSSPSSSPSSFSSPSFCSSSSASFSPSFSSSSLSPSPSFSSPSSSSGSIRKDHLRNMRKCLKIFFTPDTKITRTLSRSGGVPF